MSSLKQDPSTCQIAKRVSIAFDGDITRAHERVEAGLKLIYGREGLSDIAVSGPPAVCIAGLREVAEAGAELIQLQLLIEDIEQMERLAAEVIREIQNDSSC
jgi:hypothetical protein